MTNVAGQTHKKDIEIERRWVVLALDPDALRHPSKHLVQGYFDGTGGSTLRVRIINHGEAVLTKKVGEGIERVEKEREVDLETGKFILDAAQHRVSKSRRCIHFDGRVWELDEFDGVLKGLVIVECECDSKEEAESLQLPPWVRDAIEVTESLTNYHLALLSSRLRGVELDRPVREYLPKQRLPRVVLTGGPCSGKSTVLEAIRHELGDQVHCVPEVASILISQVGVKPDADPVKMSRFQRTLGAVQRLFEDASEQQAIDDGKKLVVLDRGLLDNAAYLKGGKGEFETVFGINIGVAARRYDVVMVLEVPPEEIYLEHSRNNPARTETHARAAELGMRISDAWETHARREAIGNQGGMGQKTETVLKKLRALLKR